jgi:hypothetical protein
MNDALREAEAVDPKWARSEQRKLWLLKGITAAVLLALAVGTLSFVLGLNNRAEITHVEKTVEHSACQVAPAGGECQKAKAESAEAANLRVTCIPFFKAGYPCPKPGSTAASRQSRRQTRRAHPIQGGGANSSPSTGHSQPAPGDGGIGDHGSPDSGGAPLPGNGGSHAPPAPGNSGSEGARSPEAAAPAAQAAPSSSQQSSSTTTERIESTVVQTEAEAAPVREGLGELVGGVGATVQGTGEVVDGTVEGVTGTTCSLAKVLCQE